MVGVINVFFKNKSAPNELKLGPSIKSGVLSTNPGSVLLSDFMGTDQTVIKVFLEANMAPSSLKLAPYSNFGVLSANLASVYLPDAI